MPAPCDATCEFSVENSSADERVRYLTWMYVCTAVAIPEENLDRSAALAEGIMEQRYAYWYAQTCCWVCDDLLQQLQVQHMC